MGARACSSSNALATRKPDEGYVSDTMRQELKSALENSWQESLLERAQISPHSAVPPLDEFAVHDHLGARRLLPSRSKIGHCRRWQCERQVTGDPVTWRFFWVELRGFEPLTPWMQTKCSSS